MLVLAKETPASGGTLVECRDEKSIELSLQFIETMLLDSRTLTSAARGLCTNLHGTALSCELMYQVDEIVGHFFRCNSNSVVVPDHYRVRDFDAID
jgi:hypothetical protein